MNKNLKVLVVIILILVVVMLGVFFMKKDSEAPNYVNVTEDKNERENGSRNETVTSNNIIDNTIIREPEEEVDKVVTNSIATPTEEEEDIVSGSVPTM